MTFVLWVVLSFLGGSLMFSLWLGRFVLGVDIRRYGDGNPGATNVLRAAGPVWGGIAVFLDALKGALPLWLATTFTHFTPLQLTMIALASILGHAFSPWLRWQGGKAVAVTFGVWSGLTIWEGPTVFGLALGVWLLFVTVSGWGLLLASFTLLAYYLLTDPQPVYLMVWPGSTLLLLYKYRADLRQFPLPRRWLRERLRWS